MVTTGTRDYVNEFNIDMTRLVCTSNQLNEEIDLLRSIARAPEQKLLEFDYQILKRDIARLFHGDKFSGDKTLLETNDMLFAKTMGILDDIKNYAIRDFS